MALLSIIEIAISLFLFEDQYKNNLKKIKKDFDVVEKGKVIASQDEDPKLQIEAADVDKSKEPSIMDRVISKLSISEKINDDILNSYLKVVNNANNSGIEVHLLEGKFGTQKWIEVLIRIPNDRKYIFNNFKNSIIECIDEYNEETENDPDLPPIDIRYEKIYRNIYWVKKDEENGTRALDLIPEEIWSDLNTKIDDEREAINGNSKLLNWYQKNKDNFLEEELVKEGIYSIEDFIGFRYMIDSENIEPYIESFCKFIEKFFDTGFIRVKNGKNDFTISNDNIDILVFHPDENINRVCNIDKKEDEEKILTLKY